MGSRDHIMELARHLRQLKRMEGALCTARPQGAQPATCWLLSGIPARPADPAALMAQLESPTPCPHALQAALGARELIELTPSRLARWSHALRCLSLSRGLERTVEQGHAQLKAWRGQDLSARLARWDAQLERLKLATSAEPAPLRWRAQHVIGPWEHLNEPAHIQTLTQEAQPDPALWAKWGTYIERLAILYGADIAANAWAWASAVIHEQRHERDQFIQKRALLISLSQRLDRRQAHPPTLPTALMALHTTDPSKPHFAHTVARAFKDYMQEEPAEPCVASQSVRSLTRALRAASCETFEQAIALCLARCPSAPLELEQVRSHLLMALRSPGKLKAPPAALLPLDETRHQELIDTLVETKQEPLWPDHIHVPSNHDAYLYQRLLEAHPPKHLMTKIAKEKIALFDGLRPLFGRWRAMERLLEVIRQHPPLDYEDRAIIEKLAKSISQADERMIYAASLYAVRKSGAKDQAWPRLEVAMRVLPQHRALLERWSEPPETLTLPDELHDHLALSRHSAQDWRRYLHHRALCGHEATPSKNLISNLERTHKHTKELEWLERALAQTDHALDVARRAQLEQRLLKLKALDLSDLADAIRRMDNQMERASEQLARQSLELLLERALLAKLKLSPQHLLTLTPDYIEALYLLSLLEDHALADQFISAVVSDSPRRELGPNVRWAKVAQGKGLDLDAWEQGFDFQIQDERGRRLRIHTEDRLWERVLMGSAFETCLALDSFNAPSALINALDLNKHIIYVRDERGQLLARKLIGLSSDLGLVGYRLYSKPALTQQPHIKEHIEAACAALAARCGARLIDRDQPQQLHPGDLYDDGAVAWRDSPQPEALAIDPEWPDDPCAHKEHRVSHHQAPSYDTLWFNIYQAQRRQDGLPALNDDHWSCIDEPEQLSRWTSSPPLDLNILQIQSHTRLAHEQGQAALCHHLLRRAAQLTDCGFDLQFTLQARSTAQTLQLLKVLLRHEVDHDYDGYEYDLAANLCPHLLWALSADPNWRLLIRELKRPKAPALRLACLEIMSQLHIPGASAALHKLSSKPHQDPALIELACARQRAPALIISDEARLEQLEAKEATSTLSCADYYHLSRIARAHQGPHPHRSRALGLLCTRSLELHALGRRRKGNLTPLTLSDPRELGPTYQLAIFKEALYRSWLGDHALAGALPWLRAITDDETQREAIDQWHAWYCSGRKSSSDRDESAVTLARMTHHEPELAHQLFSAISQDEHYQRLQWMAATITAAHYIGTPAAIQLWTQALIEELRVCPLHELRALFKPKNMEPWGVKLLQTLCAQRALWLHEHRLDRMLVHLRGFESSQRARWMVQRLESSLPDEPMGDGELSSP